MRILFFVWFTAVVMLPSAACRGQHAGFREVAESFIGTPYGGGVLEVAGEPLTVRLDLLDCTTFVEYVAAAVTSGVMPDADDPEFRAAVEKIRYRGGERNGYMSRLHYASEWIADNEKKGILRDVSEDYSGAMGVKRICFMSEHAGSYPGLGGDTVLLRELGEIENSLSENIFSYIPKNKVPGMANKLKDGDIVMFMTDVPGLDVSHMGFVYFENGRAKLLHASSRHGKVCVDPDNLADYVINNGHCTGIRVVRIIR